jgi:hypothetical protein
MNLKYHTLVKKYEVLVRNFPKSKSSTRSSWAVTQIMNLLCSELEPVGVAGYDSSSRQLFQHKVDNQGYSLPS